MTAKAAGGIVTVSWWIAIPGLEAASTPCPAARAAPARAGAEVHRDPQRSPPDHEPAGVLIEVGIYLVKPGIGQLGAGPAQRDQLPVPGQDAEVRLAMALLRVQLGPQEGRLVLRVGHIGRGPPELGELGLASLGDGLRQPGLDVIGEVLPRGVRAPFSPMNSIGVYGEVSTRPRPP